MDWKPFLGLPLWFWLFILPTACSIVFLLVGKKAEVYLKPIWKILDKIYNAAGIIAAAFMVIILLLIVTQMVARWSDVPFPGSTELAGYAMAATSFFALAYTLNHGAHIRVSILLNANNFTRKWVDLFAMFIAALIATYFARYAVKTNFLSKLLNDRTQGQDQVPEWVLSIFAMFKTAPTKWGELWRATGTEWVYTPVWLPQIPMSIGAVLLAIALWDNLSRMLVNGVSSIKGETVE